MPRKELFFPVFAVIENGSEDFEQPDTKADSLQVRNLLIGSCWKCVWVFISSTLFHSDYTNMKWTRNYHMPCQLYFSKTICCSFFLLLKVRIPSVFSAVLQISDYGSQLWGCACLTGMCSDRNACYWWDNWFCRLKNLRNDSENWVCPASTQHPHTHVNILTFPRTLVEIFSSCCNKSSPSWRPCVNVQLRVLFFFSEVMRRWDENENKNKRWAYPKIIPPSKKQCWRL